MDGTGSLVEAAAEGPHESAPVFLAEGAVEQEIARRVHRNQEIEDVAQGAQNVLLVRRRLVKDLFQIGRTLITVTHDWLLNYP